LRLEPCFFQSSPSGFFWIKEAEDSFPRVRKERQGPAPFDEGLSEDKYETTEDTEENSENNLKFKLTQ
jgi:hypothetical protein